VWLLGKDPEEEVALLPRVEGGGNDDVVSGRQLEPCTDLTQVDEGLDERGVGSVTGNVADPKSLNPDPEF
jgi:hypothetical protein